jgi:hypothetical protein
MAEINWRNMTWEPGAKARFHKGSGAPEYFTVYAGLYWYSGFGVGYYFKSNGAMLHCSYAQAQKEARRDGVECHFVDSFVVGSFRSVMG